MLTDAHRVRRINHKHITHARRVRCCRCAAAPEQEAVWGDREFTERQRRRRVAHAGVAFFLCVCGLLLSFFLLLLLSFFFFFSFFFKAFSFLSFPSLFLILSSVKVLHVWCESEEIAALFRDCHANQLAADMKQDTFVLLTVVEDQQVWSYSAHEIKSGTRALSRWRAVNFCGLQCNDCVPYYVLLCILATWYCVLASARAMRAVYFCGLQCNDCVPYYVLLCVLATWYCVLASARPMRAVYFCDCNRNDCARLRT